jgi:hypothetical protein
MIRIWLDFYEDDMSPWVLSSIHIQRLQHLQIILSPCVCEQESLTDGKVYLALRLSGKNRAMEITLNA